MATPQSQSVTWNRVINQSDVIFALATVASVMVLVIPLPSFLIDMALTVSIAIAMMLMMSVIYVKQSVQLSGFPTMLLFITLFRLALSVATTRAILDKGEAGHLITAFGNFVIQGNFVVGVVVFLILVTINFVVITKGAGRVSEVAARFTLDAMPGKQMSIDADLNAGIINDVEAKRRRARLQEEADFYGAMDGASKFVRGDAVAGIMIVAVNILGGLAIGVLQKGLPVMDAVRHYTILTVGDGLVTQIPALLVSTAAGILVTRVASSESLGRDIAMQLLSHHRALYAVSAILGVFMLIPGFPWWAFLLLSAGAFFLARIVEKNAGVIASEGVTAEAQDKMTRTSVPEKLDEWLKVETLQVELGYNLLGFLDKAKGGDLLERVTALRKNLAAELGLVLAPIRIHDNTSLGGNAYSVLLRGAEIAAGEVLPNHALAMGVGTAARPLAGRTVTEPAFGLPATWVLEAQRRTAEQLGFAVVDPLSVLITHLSETLRRHAHELLSRQDAQNLLEKLKESNAAVVQELVPNLLGVGVVHRVLQNLLREGVSIRNLGLILEKVADHAGVTKNPDELSEHARKVLSSDLVRQAGGNLQGSLPAITLDPELEQRITQSVRQSQQEITLALDPKLARHLFDGLGQKIKQMVANGLQPLVVCSPAIRLALRRFFEGAFRSLTVLAYNELPERVEIQSVGVVPNVPA